MTYCLSPGGLKSYHYKNTKRSERPQRSYVHKTHRITKSFYPKHDNRIYLGRSTSQDAELLECCAKASRETTKNQYPWDIFNAEFSTFRWLDSSSHYHLGSLRVRIAVSSPFGFTYARIYQERRLSVFEGFKRRHWMAIPKKKWHWQDEYASCVMSRILSLYTRKTLPLEPSVHKGHHHTPITSPHRQTFVELHLDVVYWEITPYGSLGRTALRLPKQSLRKYGCN